VIETYIIYISLWLHMHMDIHLMYNHVYNRCLKPDASLVINRERRQQSRGETFTEWVKGPGRNVKEAKRPVTVAVSGWSRSITYRHPDIN